MIRDAQRREDVYFSVPHDGPGCRSRPDARRPRRGLGGGGLSARPAVASLARLPLPRATQTPGVSNELYCGAVWGTEGRTCVVFHNTLPSFSVRWNPRVLEMASCSAGTRCFRGL